MTDVESRFIKATLALESARETYAETEPEAFVDGPGGCCDECGAPIGLDEDYAPPGEEKEEAAFPLKAARIEYETALVLLRREREGRTA